MNWQFHSIHEFLAMGGYAFYVWSAYGIAILSLIMAAYFFCKK